VECGLTEIKDKDMGKRYSLYGANLQEHENVLAASFLRQVEGEKLSKNMNETRGNFNPQLLSSQGIQNLGVSAPAPKAPVVNMGGNKQSNSLSSGSTGFMATPNMTRSASPQSIGGLIPKSPAEKMQSPSSSMVNGEQAAGSFNQPSSLGNTALYPSNPRPFSQPQGSPLTPKSPQEMAQGQSQSGGSTSAVTRPLNMGGQAGAPSVNINGQSSGGLIPKTPAERSNSPSSSMVNGEQAAGSFSQPSSLGNTALYPSNPRPFSQPQGSPLTPKSPQEMAQGQQYQSGGSPLSIGAMRGRVAPSAGEETGKVDMKAALAGKAPENPIPTTLLDMNKINQNYGVQPKATEGPSQDGRSQFSPYRSSLEKPVRPQPGLESGPRGPFNQSRPRPGVEPPPGWKQGNWGNTPEAELKRRDEETKAAQGKHADWVSNKDFGSMSLDNKLMALSPPERMRNSDEHSQFQNLHGQRQQQNEYELNLAKLNRQQGVIGMDGDGKRSTSPDIPAGRQDAKAEQSPMSADDVREAEKLQGGDWDEFLKNPNREGASSVRMDASPAGRRQTKPSIPVPGSMSGNDDSHIASVLRDLNQVGKMSPEVAAKHSDYLDQRIDEAGTQGRRVNMEGGPERAASSNAAPFDRVAHLRELDQAIANDNVSPELQARHDKYIGDQADEAMLWQGIPLESEQRGPSLPMTPEPKQVSMNPGPQQGVNTPAPESNLDELMGDVQKIPEREGFLSRMKRSVFGKGEDADIDSMINALNALADDVLIEKSLNVNVCQFRVNLSGIVK